MISSKKFSFFSFHKATPLRWFSSFSDTIFALSSGNSKIIRVSGRDALKSLALLSSKQNSPISLTHDKETLKKLKIKPYVAHLRKFYALDKQQSKQRALIDEGLLIYFPEPNSFTAEDVVEFHIHGSKAVQAKMLLELGKITNYRLAEGGEFTKRAFFNGRMDLMEVEGLADLINAETEEQRAQSIQHFTGYASKILERWRTNIIRCLAHAEAFIDFEEHEEDVTADVYDKVADDIKKLIEEISEHLRDNNRGEILRDGYKISIIGPPNAGKSSLLNLVARRDVAIVSEIPGTTRDILSVSLNLGGFPVILFDTAGLRETADVIENEGVKRAIKNLKESQLILLLLDADDFDFVPETRTFKARDPSKFSTFLNEIAEDRVIVVLNKADKLKEINLQDSCKILLGESSFPINSVISCKTEQNTIDLINLLSKRVKDDINLGISGSNETVSIVTKARHRIELTKCLEHLNLFLQHKNEIDISCEELREAVNCIGRLTGRIDVEQVLDVLFRDFCIGK